MKKVLRAVYLAITPSYVIGLAVIGALMIMGKLEGWEPLAYPVGLLITAYFLKAVLGSVVSDGHTCDEYINEQEHLVSPSALYSVNTDDAAEQTEQPVVPPPKGADYDMSWRY